ncbi:MAG: HNH endonuclease [Candidatus Melainabacteria bacterium]|jgi:hypothetical protein
MKSKSNNKVLYFLLYGMFSTGLYFALKSLASFMQAEGIIGLPDKISNLISALFKNPIFENIYLYIVAYLMVSAYIYFNDPQKTDSWFVSLFRSLQYGLGWVFISFFLMGLFGGGFIIVGIPSSFLWLPAFVLSFFFDWDSSKTSSSLTSNVSVDGVGSRGGSSVTRGYSSSSTSSTGSSSKALSSSTSIYTAPLIEILPAPSLTEDPKFVKSESERAQRSSEFVRKVREQYDSTCAVSGLRLFDLKGNPEVHIAHIYPKSLNGSDDPRNGICLSRLFHWAFDAGLFVIEDDLSITVNNTILNVPSYEAISKFHSVKLIHPKDAQFKPHPVFLKARRDLSKIMNEGR